MPRFAVLMLAAVAAAPAQTTDAVLSGTVLDPSGAPVPDARIMAQNAKTGGTHQTTTNDSGIYLFAALPPGVYRLSAERIGFRRFVYEDLELEVGGRVSLNLPLQIGEVTDSIEVKATAEALFGNRSTSVGTIISGQQVRDLPLRERNALDLAFLQAGVAGTAFNASVSGTRKGFLNITLDGFNVQNNDLNSGITSPLALNVDLIEEFRVVTSPADAELGRGSGQIQMLSRSGTNEYHGSLFWNHRNTVLNANNWFNNQRGRDPKTGDVISPRDVLLRHQYGARVGGPLVRNRTFIHLLYEANQARARTAVTNVVYTEPARRGVYRFFPGVLNGNANALVPTVDLPGNPVRPPQATGDLQAVNLFGRDPNRLVPDRTGAIQRLIGLTPLPNNFRVGDGLNVAGYTWSLPTSSDIDQFNLRLDHLFFSAHRLSFGYTRQSQYGINDFMQQPFPKSPAGNSEQGHGLTSLTLASGLRPNLLNEFRAGAFRPRFRLRAPWEVAGTDLQPRAGSESYLVRFSQVTDPLNTVNDPQGSAAPVYQLADSLTWLKGRHGFKAGGEVRFTSTNSFSSFNVMPRATLGLNVAPIQNLGSISGIGPNLGRAEAVLSELSGSLSDVVQGLYSPGGPDPVFLPGEVSGRNWRQREFGLFVKDDWKLTSSLTLNLGIRYEWYGVPWEANGKSTGLVGGSGAVFGVSGTSFADLFQPGRMAGSLTRLQLVGPGSPNPGLRLFENDNNNFAPAVGLSWALPRLGRLIGKDTTVLRLGYGIAYQRQDFNLPISIVGELLHRRGQRLIPSSYLDLSGIRLPLGLPGRPLDLVPFTDRSTAVGAFDDHLRTPYVQNWNVSLQRRLAANTVLEVRYVGSKGTRLIRTQNVNDVNILENGILEAFLITQAGGDAPLLDRIFRGVSIPGLGVVDGVGITGSQAVRAMSTTQAFFSGHGVAPFANYLNTSPQFTGEAGGLLRRAGLPENSIVANPQYGVASLTSNFASSTYNSMQVEVIRRFSSGWTVQGNYNWSRTLGEDEGDSQGQFARYRDLRNWRLDKRLLESHRTQVARANGTWELPFGPRKRWAGGTRGLAARLLERWQLGGILGISTGPPIDVLAPIGSLQFSGTFSNTPIAVAPFSKATGAVRRTGEGVVYFEGLQQVPDPSIAGLTTLGGVRGRSMLRSIADSSGRILLVNPTPGVNGSLAPRFLEGPGLFSLDVNLIKRIQLAESKSIELRADALSILNRPNFFSPITLISSPNFGRISGAGGNRIMAVSARLNF